MFLTLALCCLTSAASEVELVQGRPQQGTIAAGKSQSYVLSLSAGDYVRVRVETRAAAGLRLTVYGPSGSKVRGFYVGSENASFAVDATGPHHIEIASPIENAAEVDYTITLMKVVALADRVACAPQKIPAPRIYGHKFLDTQLPLPAH